MCRSSDDASPTLSDLSAPKSRLGQLTMGERTRALRQRVPEPRLEAYVIIMKDAALHISIGFDRPEPVVTGNGQASSYRITVMEGVMWCVCATQFHPDPWIWSKLGQVLTATQRMTIRGFDSVNSFRAHVVRPIYAEDCT